MPVKHKAKGGSAQERRRTRRAAARAHTLTLDDVGGIEELLQSGVLKVSADLAAARGMTLEEATDAIVFAVSGSTSLPLSDRDVAWDAGVAAKSLSAAQLSKAFFWKDPDGDPKTKAAYKLGFASAEGGTLTAIWKGVTAAAGAIQGARGGVQIPDGDVAGVKARIAGYYAKAARKYGDDQIKPPWEAADDKEAASLLAYAEVAGVTYLERDGDATLVTTEAYQERLAYWWGELGVALEPASPERALLEQVREALQDDGGGDPMQGQCADEACGHLAEEHAGILNDGACGVTGCSCDGFDDSSDAEMAAAEDERGAVTVHLAFAPEAREEAVRQLVRGLRFTTEGTEAEGVKVAETLTARLENFVAELEREYAEVALPVEHQPGSTVPPLRPSPEAPEAQPTLAGAQLRWTANFCPEGALTDDGRAFAPGSITWRELPLSLMAMIETADGHDGAQVCGRIDSIWRDGNMVKASGIFDSGEYGREIARMVGDGTLRGVSVDIAALESDVVPKSDYFDEEGRWRDEPAAPAEGDAEPSLLDVLFGDEEVIWVVTKGVIGASTVCPFPAFADANIELSASLAAAAKSPAIWTVTQQGGWVVTHQPRVGAEVPADGSEHELVTELREAFAEPITASAAGLAPVVPPAEWFEDPAFEELTPLTVDEDGRVYGHAAQWDTCHIGIPDVCTVAPHTETGNAYFHLGEILCEGGVRHTIGKITMGTGHADRGLGWKEAAAHYDNTGTVVADVISGEDEHGIWVAGALRPNVDAERARELRAATLSGDWRNVNGNLELVALLAVNVPGFPVPRTRALVASGEDGNEVLALVAAGIYAGDGPDDVEFRIKVARLAAEADRERFAALADRARGV